jgi:hypothetical protein
MQFSIDKVIGEKYYSTVNDAFSTPYLCLGAMGIPWAPFAVFSPP